MVQILQNFSNQNIVENHILNWILVVHTHLVWNGIDERQKDHFLVSKINFKKVTFLFFAFYESEAFLKLLSKKKQNKSHEI